MIRTGARSRPFLTRYVLTALALGVSIAAPDAVFAAESPDFTVAPATPAAGQSATFTAANVRQSDSVQWDFESDGIFDASGKTVQHVYATAGQRTALMRVRGPGAQTRDVRKPVIVTGPPVPPPPAAPSNRPPVAAFTFFPRQPLGGDSVELFSTSSDAESPIASHAWDLDGDGQFDDASGVTAARSFSAPGQYTVGLRVTDAKGAADVESRTITVAARLASPARLGLMSPFPLVRIIGRSTRRGARIKLLLVRGAPRGAKVTVSCRGDGCGRRRQSRMMRSGRLRFRSFERLVRTGTRIRIFVTRGGEIGKYTSFKIRRGRPPLRRDLCVTAVGARPTRCPSP